VLDHPLLDAARELPLAELGRSTEGRAILGGTFGPIRTSAGVLLVMGGIHGDEPSSVEAVLALGRRLASGTAPAGPVLLLPALNPDGLSGNRKNSARDVDLNRNFPARSFRADHAPGYFPGEHPLSEPETRLIADLIDGSAPISGVVAVHAPLCCVNYDGPAAAWAAAVGAACGWPVRGDIGYPTPGSLGSWLGLDRGLPVLTLELPPGAYAAFASRADAALDAAVECANHVE
jgi:murein peptide amidase A